MSTLQAVESYYSQSGVQHQEEVERQGAGGSAYYSLVSILQNSRRQIAKEVSRRLPLLYGRSHPSLDAIQTVLGQKEGKLALWKILVDDFEYEPHDLEMKNICEIKTIIWGEALFRWQHRNNSLAHFDAPRQFLRKLMSKLITIDQAMGGVPFFKLPLNSNLAFLTSIVLTRPHDSSSLLNTLTLLKPFLQNSMPGLEGQVRPQFSARNLYPPRHYVSVLYLSLGYAGGVVPSLIDLYATIPIYSDLVALWACDARFIGNVLIAHDQRAIGVFLEQMPEEDKQADQEEEGLEREKLRVRFIMSLHGVLSSCVQMMERGMLRVQEFFALFPKEKQQQLLFSCFREQDQQDKEREEERKRGRESLKDRARLVEQVDDICNWLIVHGSVQTQPLQLDWLLRLEMQGYQVYNFVKGRKVLHSGASLRQFLHMALLGVTRGSGREFNFMVEHLFPSNLIESELRARQYEALEMRLSHGLGQGPSMIKLKVKLVLVCLVVLQKEELGIPAKYSANIFLAALLCSFFGPLDLRSSIQHAVQDHFANGAGGLDQSWGKGLVKLAFLNQEESNRQDRYENYFVLSSLVRLMLNELLKLASHIHSRIFLSVLLKVVCQFLPCLRLRRLLWRTLPELPTPLAVLDVSYYKLLDKFMKLCSKLEPHHAEQLWQASFNTSQNIEAALQFLVISCARGASLSPVNPSANIPSQRLKQRLYRTERLHLGCIMALIQQTSTNVVPLFLDIAFKVKLYVFASWTISDLAATDFFRILFGLNGDVRASRDDIETTLLDPDKCASAQLAWLKSEVERESRIRWSVYELGLSRFPRRENDTTIFIKCLKIILEVLASEIQGPRIKETNFSKQQELQLFALIVLMNYQLTRMNQPEDSPHFTHLRTIMSSHKLPTIRGLFSAILGQRPQQEVSHSFLFANINYHDLSNYQVFHYFSANLLTFTLNFQSKLPQGLYALWRRFHLEISRSLAASSSSSLPSSSNPRGILNPQRIDRRTVCLLIRHLAEIAHTLSFAKLFDRHLSVPALNAKHLFLHIFKILMREANSYREIPLSRLFKSSLTANANLLFWTSIALLQCLQDHSILQAGLSMLNSLTSEGSLLRRLLFQVEHFSQNFLSYSKRIMRGLLRLNDLLYLALRTPQAAHSVYIILSSLVQMPDQALLLKPTLYDQLLRFLMFSPYILHQLSLLLHRDQSLSITPQLFKQAHGVPLQPDFLNRGVLLQLLTVLLPDLKNEEHTHKLMDLIQSFQTLSSVELIVENYSWLVAVLLEQIVLKKNMTDLLHRVASLLGSAHSRSPFAQQNHLILQILLLFAKQHQLSTPDTSAQYADALIFPPYLQIDSSVPHSPSLPHPQPNCYTLLYSQLRQVINHDNLTLQLPIHGIFKKHRPLAPTTPSSATSFPRTRPVPKHSPCDETPLPATPQFFQSSPQQIDRDTPELVSPQTAKSVGHKVHTKLPPPLPREGPIRRKSEQPSLSLLLGVQDELHDGGINEIISNPGHQLISSKEGLERDSPIKSICDDSPPSPFPFHEPLPTLSPQLKGPSQRTQRGGSFHMSQTSKAHRPLMHDEPIRTQLSSRSQVLEVPHRKSPQNKRNVLQISSDHLDSPPTSIFSRSVKGQDEGPLSFGQSEGEHDIPMTAPPKRDAPMYSSTQSRDKSPTFRSLVNRNLPPPKSAHPTFSSRQIQVPPTLRKTSRNTRFQVRPLDKGLSQEKIMPENESRSSSLEETKTLPHPPPPPRTTAGGFHSALQSSKTLNLTVISKKKISFESASQRNQRSTGGTPFVRRDHAPLSASNISKYMGRKKAGGTQSSLAKRPPTAS